MSAPGQDQTQDAPILPDGTVPENAALVTNALLRAVRRAAEDSAGAEDPRETKELGQAALAFAQAIVVLDPGLDANGVPLDHHMAIADARRAAAAPTPARGTKP